LEGAFSMQISKKKVNRDLERQFRHLLFQTLVDIKNPQEMGSFLKDLFSKTELSAITKRLAAVYLLKKGKNYREIKDTLKLSSATISSLAEQVEKGRGFKIALGKIAADEWAERWVGKIKSVFSMR
jgi:uncharacterized protein YerC